MFEFFGAKAYHICACDSTVIFRATKCQYSQNFSALWNVHKPNFTLISWGNPKIFGQKNSKFSIRSKFIVGSILSCSTVFSIYWYFIETTI